MNEYRLYDLSTVGERIRGLRELEGLSQDQLATMLGFSKVTVWSITSGIPLQKNQIERSAGQTERLLTSSLETMRTEVIFLLIGIEIPDCGSLVSLISLITTSPAGPGRLFTASAIVVYWPDFPTVTSV